MPPPRSDICCWKKPGTHRTRTLFQNNQNKQEQTP